MNWTATLSYWCCCWLSQAISFFILCWQCLTWLESERGFSLNAVLDFKLVKHYQTLAIPSFPTENKEWPSLLFLDFYDHFILIFAFLLVYWFLFYWGFLSFFFYWFHLVPMQFYFSFSFFTLFKSLIFKTPFIWSWSLVGFFLFHYNL